MKTCTKCSTSKSDKAFPADGRTKDNLASVCADCRFTNDNMSTEETREVLRDFGFDQEVADGQLSVLKKQLLSYADDAPLETVTMERVAILAEGGPYYGTGSPPEGDYYTKADLETIADANRELAEEIKPVNKLGHSKDQKLLANSGLAVDEQPAAGWLVPSSFVVEEDDGGKWKLYSDIAKVPAKLAKLFESGAFRTRSVELSKVTAQSQTVMSADDTEKTIPGKVYECVVTGLAWLGAKAPAVRTLDDIYAYYHGDGKAQTVELLYADAGNVPAGVTRVIEYADDATAIIWEPEDGFQDLSSDLSAALNPTGGGDRRYWVQDVSVKLDKCIVNDWQSNATWIVPFTMDDNGDPVPAAATEWVLAEQAWVKAADELAERNFGDALKSREATADTNLEMPELIKKLSDMNDEQIVALAKTFGFEGEDATALRPQLEEHLKTFSVEPPENKPEDKPEDKPEAAADDTPAAREMAELRAQAALGERAYEERRIEKRETLIAKALGQDGGVARILPAHVDDWRKFFDANPELAATQLNALPEIVSRTYGSDDLPTGITAEDVKSTGDDAWAEYAAATGVPVEVGR